MKSHERRREGTVYQRDSREVWNTDYYYEDEKENELLHLFFFPFSPFGKSKISFSKKFGFVEPFFNMKKKELEKT